MLQFAIACSIDKMLSLQADTIYDVIKPVHFCSQLIGISLFTLKYKKGVFVQTVTGFNILCMMVSTALLSGFTVWFIFNFEKFYFLQSISSSSFFENSMLCAAHCSLFSIIFAYWWIFGMRQHFVRILNHFKMVDEELYILGVPVDLKKHKKVILILLCAFKLILLLAFILTRKVNHTFQGHNFNLIPVVLMYTWIEVNHMILSHLTLWMWAVKSRYQKLNEFVRKSFLESSAFTPKNAICKLNTVALLHDKLVDISECINRCYGTPVRKYIKSSISFLLTKKFYYSL